MAIWLGHIEKKSQIYLKLKHSYSSNEETQPPVNFFGELKYARRDYVYYLIELLKADEEVKGDWLEAIGGPSLVKHVFQVL